jgi:hypothetical protein
MFQNGLRMDRMDKRPVKILKLGIHACEKKLLNFHDVK